MFSRTTMASSTTKPVEMVRAISERLSSEKWSRYITPKVPTSDKGTATLGMMVAQASRRNRNTTKITSRIETSRVTSTSRTAARIVTVRSMTMLVRISGEIDASSEGSSALMRSTVSMTLAPAILNMTMRTAGCPLANPDV